MFPEVIQAGAGPHDLGPGDNKGDTFPELMAGHDPNFTANNEQDPIEQRSSAEIDDYSDSDVHDLRYDEGPDSWDVIASYIFQNSDARCAVMHHHDVVSIRTAGPTSDLLALLAECKPHVVVDSNGVGSITYQEVRPPSKSTELSSTPKVVKGGPFSELAAELTDRIIDFLHDDKQALRTCTLTHSSWLATSRFHLFDTIVVDGGGRNKEQMEDLEARASGARFPSAFSRVRTVNIALLVSQDRAKRLKDAISLYEGLVWRYGFSKPDGPMVDLPAIHLSLEGRCNLMSKGGQILLAFSQISDKVTHLRLSNATLFNRNELWPFISLFPNLGSLETTRLRFHRSEDVKFPLQHELKNLPLSKIRIDTGSMGWTIDGILANANEFTLLEEFGIWYDGEMQPALLQVAEAIRDRVKVLRLGLNGHGHYKASSSERFETGQYHQAMSVFISEFRVLDTLVLDNLILDLDVDQYSKNSDPIPRILGNLSSPIRKLVFEISAKEVSQLDLIEWSAVDDVVANPLSIQFASLDLVEVLLSDRRSSEGGNFFEGGDSLYRILKPRLPKIEGMGLLRTSFSSSLRFARPSTEPLP